MKKVEILLVCLLMAVAAQAQKNYDIDEIRTGWAKKAIAGVKDGNILTLLTAFNKTWRTAPATELLAHPVSNEGNEDAYAIVVDKPNGFVSAKELGDDGEDIEACVWKRNNGHRLFAVVYTRYHGLTPHPIALFYDYDATKGMLNPEFDVQLVQFLPSFSDPSVDFVHMTLPQKGKDVVVTEYIMPWGFSIKQTYKWDGMKPVWSSASIENMDKILAVHEKEAVTDLDVEFTKYALMDFDEDNRPELWLSDESGDNQAIFAIHGENDIEMLAATYFKTHFSFYNNNGIVAICTAGSCGTGCFSADFVLLNDSKPVGTFQDFQEWNYKKDEMEHTYSRDEKKLSQKEGVKFLDSLGEAMDITPLMHGLGN